MKYATAAAQRSASPCAAAWQAATCLLPAGVPGDRSSSLGWENRVDRVQPRPQLGPPDRLLSLMARRRRIAQHLPH